MAKKFVSVSDLSLELFNKALFKNLIKRGAGSTLQVKKEGKFSNVSIDALENLIKWLEVKTTILSPKEMAEKFNPEVIETPVVEVKIEETTPSEWNSIFVELPNIGGKSMKRLSLRVWNKLMLEEGVSPSQAKWILKNVFMAKSLDNAEKAKAIRALNSEKSTFSSTWKLRITRLINSL